MDFPQCSNISRVDPVELELPDLKESLVPEKKPSVFEQQISPPREEESESPEPIVTQRHQRPTECAICKLPANGYHYDVPSCNGCKTFFRRMCISEKSFPCKAKGDCFDLTIRDKPSKCRSCRYQKCISAGMNPLAMQVDEKEATSGNFKKLAKRVNQSNSFDDEEKDKEKLQIAQKQTIKTITNFENKIQNLIDNLSYLEAKVAKLRMSAYNPHWRTFPNLEGFLKTANKINFADSSGPMPGWPLKTPSSPPKPDFAMQKGPQYSHDKKQWFIYDLMVSVEYVKTFFFFGKLDFEDKLILVRYVALALMNLHISYFTVAKKYDSVIHPDGNLAPMKVGMVYERTVMSISPLIRCDIHETEYVLLKAICLCNPAVPGLSPYAREILAKEREQYADALFDHCLRNRKDGPSQFAELIGIVDLLERQQRMQKDLHLLHVAPFVSKIPKEDRMQLIEDIMND
ncbi:hypothetical protein CAEBREN_20373 [Caenorhabditis brenneri]|uniref:Uncharacterized protein n=1 Tax=Caenorhabditis brenneri TaxID=135651 RepID=G0MSC5_CAEBE|nr:hypothetical protein CAEBREN_20373 [Caenorhabditis brenneri]